MPWSIIFVKQQNNTLSFRFERPSLYYHILQRVVLTTTARVTSTMGLELSVLRDSVSLNKWNIIII